MEGISARIPYIIHAINVGYYISGFTDAINLQKSHLERLLAMLPLKGLHWINFNHRDISLITLTR